MGWNELVGGQLGDYRISGEIARGGMSRVYRAMDLQSRREVAVKVMTLNSDNTDHSTFVRRFEHEAQAIEMLDHPNIVKVFGAGRTDEFVFIAMQLVLGGTFRQKLGQPLPISEAVTYIIQMARALHHAHTHNVIHRDVKPANMLLDNDDSSHMLLADFGIAKIMGQKGVTKTGTAVGTPEYMAPEQAKGDEVDHRADIYGLTCVLYEALTGRPPFVGPTALSICYQHVHTRPAYVRGFNPDVPRSLALVIEQGLAKDPADRFTSAESFANALHPFTEPKGDMPRRSTISRPLTPPVVGTVAGISDEMQSYLDQSQEVNAGHSAFPSTPMGFSPVDLPVESTERFPVLDLSSVQSHIPTQSPPSQEDDASLHQTQEILPMPATARPRHSRPVQPALRLKSRPVTQPVEFARATSALRGSLPNVSSFQGKNLSESTVHLPQHKAPAPSRNRILVLVGIAAVISVITLGGIIFAKNSGYPLVVQTATKTPLPTLAPSATALPQTTASPTLTAPTVTPPPTVLVTVTPTSIAIAAIPFASATATINLSCNSSQSQFTAYTRVYIDICVAQGYAPGTISAVFYRNGTYVLTPGNTATVAGGYYLSIDPQYMSPGNYTVLVEWNNQVSRTLTFTLH